MEFQNFIKKPLVIANIAILFCFLILPYFTLSMGGYGAYSKSGIGLFFTLFDNFNFLNLILIIVPIASVNILFQSWKGTINYVKISKIVILVILGYLFLHIAFFAEKSSIKFVGFGLWLSLIVAIAQMFESKINEMICKKPQDTNNPPTE